MRVKSILSKTFSALVIVLSPALLIIVWIFQDDVASSAVIIFTEVDNVAQVMRSGIARVEPQMLNLQGVTRRVETASKEIAQNISEEGIILRLLPQSVIDGFTTSSQSLQADFIAVYDLLDVTSDVLLALVNMPFIDIPKNGLSKIATLHGSMEEFSGRMESLKTDIDEFHSGAAVKIFQVTNAAIFLGDEVDNFHSDLVQIDSDLDAIQIRVRKYQRLTTSVTISMALILSLQSAWVGYSQVMMVSYAETLTSQKSLTHLEILILPSMRKSLRRTSPGKP